MSAAPTLNGKKHNWFGAVPNGWRTVRLKSVISSCLNGVWGDDPDGVNDLVCLRVADFDPITLGVSEAKLTLRSIELSKRSRRILQEGDLLLEKSGGGELQPVGRVVAYDFNQPAVCSNFIGRLTPDHSQIRSRFLLYVFHTLWWSRLNVPSIKQTTGIQNLDEKHYFQNVIPLPPREEQDAIVAFLDRKLEKIDRFIANKRRLIELLEEEFLLDVDHTTTKGIAKSKTHETGFDWIGSVPKHWNVAPLKYAFESMDYGISDSGSDDGHIPVLTMGHIQAGKVRVPDSGGVSEVDSRLLLREADLLFNRTNSAELVGKVGLFHECERDVTFASYLVRLRPNPTTDSLYMNYLLNSPQILSFARRLAIPSLHQSNLNPTRYGRIHVALPPHDEQIEIAEWLNKKGDLFFKTRQKCKKEIDLMNEFRRSLVAEAVTGKIDVRSKT